MAPRCGSVSVLRLTVNVADFQKGQFSIPGAGGVEGDEQDVFARGARRLDELRDFFPAKNRRESMGLFRIGSLSNAPCSAERLDLEKAQSRQVSPYGILRQLASLEQLGLIFANVSRAQAIGGNSGIVEQNLRLCERSDVWYFGGNSEAGVLPASFCVDGAQGHLL